MANTSLNLGIKILYLLLFSLLKVNIHPVFAGGPTTCLIRTPPVVSLLPQYINKTVIAVRNFLPATI